MAIGYFLRVGDKTTCGGQILTGDNTMQWYGVAGAREGDMVSCGKHSGAYRILGGVSSMWLEDRKHAGTLESFSSCPCHARFIPSISDCYVNEDNEPTQLFNTNALINELSHRVRYQCRDDDGTLLINSKYCFYLPTGEHFNGTTDSEGYTSWHDAKEPQNPLFHILKD